MNTQQMWVLLMQNTSLLLKRHKSALVPPPGYMSDCRATASHGTGSEGKAARPHPPSPMMQNKKCLAGSENRGRMWDCGADVSGGS